MDLPLSVALREGSADAHRAAEDSPFIGELLGGRLLARAHTDLLLRLRPVYASLENALRRRLDDPVVAAVHDPDLDRVAAIDADLEHWAPGQAHDVDSPAARAYVARIEDDARRPDALLAHHYTRYLGDLSGGRVIASAMHRTYGPAAEGGVAFYEFPAIAHPRRYKDAYRARLDALALPAARVARLVDDVRAVFALNQAVFAELAADLPRYRLP